MSAASSVGTGQMIAEGNSYCNGGSVYVPTSAIPNDSTTAGRTPPSYMTSAGYYGVPYSYGGFDDLANFGMHMSQANSTNYYKAGDVDTSQQIVYFGTGASQWSGKPFFRVDCSGFISRCWGLSTKQGTTTLLNNVAPYCPATFQQGDIMDWSGHHVRMYVDSATSPSSTSYYLYEEAAGSPYGVQFAFYLLSDQVSQGYQLYRFNGAISTGYYAPATSCPR
jgi:hypothetical protein